ncbi:MAG: hypothetical protein K6G63_02285 [Eubacterium sp.]|nr:hypothetical protein [Eubacterium sp.]
MKKRFLLLNTIIPLIIGGTSYYILSPNVLFVKAINSLLGISNIIAHGSPQTAIGCFVRFYLLDMLWGYSLVFALVLCLGSNAAIKIVLFIAFVFSLSVELLQLTSFMPGVFDLMDISSEIIAELIAALIIHKHFLRGGNK